MTKKRLQFETATPLKRGKAAERRALRLTTQADIIIESHAGSLFQPIEDIDYEAAFDAMCRRVLGQCASSKEPGQNDTHID